MELMIDSRLLIEDELFQIDLLRCTALHAFSHERSEDVKEFLLDIGEDLVEDRLRVLNHFHGLLSERLLARASLWLVLG